MTSHDEKPPRPSANGTRGMIVSFLATFTITILGLLMTTLIVRARASRIVEAADAIAKNAAPSVESLSTLRTTLRHMEVGLDDYVDRVAQEGRPLALPASLRRDEDLLAREWSTYLKLPAFPGERGLRPDVRSGIEALRGSMKHLIASIREGDREEAKTEFDHEMKPLFDDVEGRLHEATALNVAGSTEAAAAIEETLRTTRALSDVLYAAWGLFAVAAAVVAVRLVRQYSRITENQIADLELFAGQLAHDVRGPLSSAAMAVTLSQQRTSDEKTKELLGRAHRTLLRIGELVDGLLLLAKAVQASESGARADVKNVLTDLIANFQPIAKEKHVELELGEVAGCSVACSAGVLTSMVGNLLDNSIKYMGDSPIRNVTLRALDRDGRVRIQVEDTGPGIPRAAQHQVFEPYARAAPAGVGGLGLGLATVKRLAEVVGGATGLESERGTGTLLWIELPKGPADLPDHGGMHAS